MASDWTIDDLQTWDARIREKVAEFGLSCFTQEFEICDHAQMLGYMAYSGMPAHYPHWSYGKAYEKLKTMYDHGVSGLPYEMVINANPSLAYLMQGNTLCLQILTMAHVYAHNDFFKNNFTFRETHPEVTLSRFKASAQRIRAYQEDPSIGLEQVEEVLDAAHALSLQCWRDTAVRKLSPQEQRQRAIEAARPERDPYAHLKKAREYVAPDLERYPLEPEQDILLFIRDNNPMLAEWVKDVLTIVHEQTLYFLPQIETKIMNEGWASYWHYRIMNALDLPQDLQLEFMVRHNQVVRPHVGGLNPYHLGCEMWKDIIRRCDEPTAEEIEAGGRPGKSGRDEMFAVREVDRDVSFLRRFLTQDLMRRLDMFEYKPREEEIVVEATADSEDWQKVKDTLLKSVGMGSVPVIQIEDADYRHNRSLYVRHLHDGRDLQPEYAEKTLSYLQRLWGREVYLETLADERKVVMAYGPTGLTREAAAGVVALS